jgi:hypothetical protein
MTTPQQHYGNQDGQQNVSNGAAGAPSHAPDPGAGYGGHGYPAAGGPGAGAAPSATRAGAGGKASATHGRDKIDWGPEVWRRIDAAVKEEITRSRVAAKFLPTVHVPAKATTVPADVVSSLLIEGNQAIGALTVDETATTRVNEFWVEFALTPAQVEEEAHAAQGDQQQGADGAKANNGHQEQGAAAHHGQASTGVSLATRAANVLAQVEDFIVFNGQNALQSMLLGAANSPVNFRITPGTLDLGLLSLLLPNGNVPALIGGLPSDQIVQVPQSSSSTAPPGSYQENTVAAVARAFAILQSKGQYGPYALVLQTFPFADTFSPLATTLITPAEPIRHLMNAGFFGTGTLPPFLKADGTNTGGLPMPGSIAAALVTTPGSGYSAATPPTVTFSGGTATGIAIVSPGGQITGVTLTNPGTGYTQTTPVAATFALGVPGTGAQANGFVVQPPPSGSTAPSSVAFTGLVVSLGGNTMDLVRGRMSDHEDVVVRFEQKDVDGNYRFRVVERFALRLKDITAVVQLQFMASNAPVTQI